MPEVPLTTQVMGILATAYSDEGIVLGPVEPVRVELQPYPDGFTMVLVFHLLNDSTKVVVVREVSVDVAGMVRQLPSGSDPVLMQPEETMSIQLSLSAAFPAAVNVRWPADA